MGGKILDGQNFGWLARIVKPNFLTRLDTPWLDLTPVNLTFSPFNDHFRCFVPTVTDHWKFWQYKISEILFPIRFRLLLVVQHCTDHLESLRFVDVRNIDTCSADCDVSTLESSLSNLRRFEFATSDEMSPRVVDDLIGQMKCLEWISYRDRINFIPIQQLFVALKQIKPGETIDIL